MRVSNSMVEGIMKYPIYCCLFLLVATQLSFAQQKDSRYPPIDNSEFYDVVSHVKVTSRFEIYTPKTADDMKLMKSMGFDQVMLDNYNLHPLATSAGLDVVFANWFNHTTPKSKIEKLLAVANQVEPGRLKAISLMDEPERNSPQTPFQYYIDLYKEMRPKVDQISEEIAIENSYWGPLVFWDQRYYDYFAPLYQSVDTMRIMPYPDLHESPLRDVYMMMQRSKKVMGMAKVEVPQVVILQAWVLPPKNKLPEIDELRVMSYQAMLGGAEVLSLFEFKPKVWEQKEGFAEGVKKLMRELVGLRERLKGAELATKMKSNGVLESHVSFQDGRSAVIQVNTNRKAVDGLKGLEIIDPTVEMKLVQKNNSATTTIGCNAQPRFGHRLQHLKCMWSAMTRQRFLRSSRYCR